MCPRIVPFIYDILEDFPIPEPEEVDSGDWDDDD